MDWLLILGAGAAAGIGIGLPMIAYTLLTRWPSSPGQLAERIYALEMSEAKRIAEFNSAIEAVEGMSDQIERRTQRLKKQQDRAAVSEQPQQQAFAEEIPNGPLTDDQLRALQREFGGVMRRAGR